MRQQDIKPNTYVMITGPRPQETDVDNDYQEDYMFMPWGPAPRRRKRKKHQQEEAPPKIRDGWPLEVVEVNAPMALMCPLTTNQLEVVDLRKYQFVPVTRKYAQLFAGSVENEKLASLEEKHGPVEFDRDTNTAIKIVNSNLCPICNEGRFIQVVGKLTVYKCKVCKAECKRTV